MARRPSSLALAFFAGCVIACGGSPLGPLAGLGVGEVISSVEDAAARLIDLAAGRADRSLLRVAYSVELSAERLRASYGDALDETVGELDGSRRAALQDVVALVSELEGAIAGPVDTLESVEEKLSDTVGRLPFVKGYPALLGWEPLYVVAKTGRPVRVTIRGRQLSWGDPYAEVEGERIDPLTKSASELVFEIPQSLVPNTSFEPITLDVHAFAKARRWLILEHLREHTFRVSVFTAPSALGVLSVFGSEEVEARRRETRTTKRFHCHAEHCQHCQDSDRVTVDDNEARLVKESIRQHMGFRTNQWDAGFRDVSNNGFTAWWWASSYGCGPFGIKGTRGQVQLHFTYDVESVMKSIQETALSTNKPLHWGNDVRLTSERPFVSVTAVLATMLGGTEVVQPGRPGRFIELSHDPITREIVVRPKTIEEVLDSANLDY